jgi:hypothetical protein
VFLSFFGLFIATIYPLLAVIYHISSKSDEIILTEDELNGNGEGKEQEKTTNCVF